MKSSPATPTGTGERCWSRIYSSVLAIGRPMSTGPAFTVSVMGGGGSEEGDLLEGGDEGEGSAWTQDQMVVSVGPYMFQTAPARSTILSARSWRSASPPTSTLRSLLPSQPASSNS